MAQDLYVVNFPCDLTPVTDPYPTPEEEEEYDRRVQRLLHPPPGTLMVRWEGLRKLALAAKPKEDGMATGTVGITVTAKVPKGYDSWESFRNAMITGEPKEANMLYEVAVVRHGKDGEDEIIIKPVTVTAPSELVAAFQVGSALGMREDKSYRNIEVIVRPFQTSR